MAKTSVMTADEIRARGGRTKAELSEQLTQAEAQLKKVEENKPTRTRLMEELRDTFRRYGLDPIEELIKLVQRGGLTPDQEIKVWTELAGYKYPKLKSVEMQGQVDMNFTIVVKRFSPEDSEQPLNDKISPLDGPIRGSLPQPVVARGHSDDTVVDVASVVSEVKSEESE